MRRSLQEHHSHVQVAVGLALLALLLLALVLVVSSPAPASPGERTLLARQTAATGAAQRGTRGRRGDRGPRGYQGPRGPEGRMGPQGPAGIDAGPARQFISIGWQNGDYSGHDRQSFVAPGIGVGEVRCTPPNQNEPTGVQWVRFFPYDAGTADQGPSKWSTTMWTVRNGGNMNDLDSPHLSVVRTARLDRPNQVSGFNERMNTQTVGYDVKSTGMFTGMITTEPYSPATAKPPSTTFRLTWHWDFGTGYDNPDGRCYVAGTFVTKGT